MKKIEIVIRPTKMESVCSVLERNGYPGLMITEIQGHGKQKGLTQQWRGQEYKLTFLPKLKIEAVIKDKDIKAVLKEIRDSAFTGEIGDGKIFVSNVEDVVRIRTDERGESAL